MKETINRQFIEQIIKYASARHADFIAENTPEGTVLSHDYSESFKSSLKKLMDGQKRKNRLRNAAKKAVRVSAVILIIIAVACATIYSVDAFRVPVLNFLSQNGSDSYTIHTFAYDADYSGFSENIHGMYLPQYIPSGYALQKIDKGEAHCVLTFANKEDNQFRLKTVMENSTIAIDNELKQETIELNGEEAQLYTGKNAVILLFSYKKHTFMLNAFYIDSAECLKIAESMRYYR